MARPKFEITEDVCEKAEEYAARGLSLEQIALMLGICYDTLNNKQKEFSEFSEAIKRGKAHGISMVSSKLYEKASEGDNTAMIFFLKNRDPENWKDVQRQEQTGANGGAIKTESTWTVNPVSPVNAPDANG